ncbi:MAG: hypothetical protein MUO63_05675, partial [Desulfobulbaceae bacterium]|nr:hypothetical protein [Desulfobulbaceae bacterium]
KKAEETVAPPAQEMTVAEKSSQQQPPAAIPAPESPAATALAPPQETATTTTPAPATEQTARQDAETSTGIAAPPAEPPARTAKVQKKAMLPAIPVVLTIVSGDETLAPFVLNHIEAALADSGLHVTSIAEIPVLMEKMQMGSLPISWYDIKRLVPSQSANIVLISQVQQTGSMPLQYYGRSQTLTTVSFTVRAVDMETGAAAGPPASGTAKFTPLNMDEELRKAVNSSVGGMGQSIKQYWQQKLKSDGPRG